MDDQVIFNFKTDISSVTIPDQLNNPFGSHIPEIARVASKEFQKFIISEYKDCENNFFIKKGKMFGVLVIQKGDYSYGYLGAVSGKLPGKSTCNHLVPSLFDDSTDDFFLEKGMNRLKEITCKINASNNQSEISSLKNIRKQKSIALQNQLFENYQFLNCFGDKKGVLEIFINSIGKKPPAAAGECAAPKLLQYAFKNALKPIAIAEFWWGNSIESSERIHNVFYPACTRKCRPILEYMLDNRNLHHQANSKH